MSDTLSLPPSKPSSSSPSREPAHVQAYAKLEGDNVCYYMKELHITIGRKINPQDDINVDLGPTKAISRQHAKIYYNLVDQKFELSVQGKNGAVIDDVFYKKGSNIKLEHGSKIQIGNQTFYFLLPKIPSENHPGQSTSRSFSPCISDSNLHGEISSLQITTWNPSAPRPKLIPIAAKPPISTSLSLSPATPGLPASLPARSSAYREIRAARPQRPLFPAIPQAVPPSTPSSRKPFTIPRPSSEIPKDSPHVKPPYSYASMIAQAINSVPEKKMTLNNIYNYIATKYPYYKLSENGWQNSIRHNLSLNKSFTKVPRLQSEPGKGSFWTITSNSLVEYGDGVYKRRRPSSASSSARAASNSPYAPDQKTARHAAFYSNPNAVAQPQASHSLHHLPPRLLSTSFPPSSDVNQVLPPLNFGKFPPLTSPPSSIPTSVPAPSDTFSPLSSDLSGNVSQTLSKLSLKSSLPSSTSRVKVQDLVHANPSSTANVKTPPNPPSSSS